MFWIVVILVISCFGFEGWILVLIASVPGLCILFTFISISFSVLCRMAIGSYSLSVFECYTESFIGLDLKLPR